MTAAEVEIVGVTPQSQQWYIKYTYPAIRSLAGPYHLRPHLETWFQSVDAAQKSERRSAQKVPGKRDRPHATVAEPKACRVSPDPETVQSHTPWKSALLPSFTIADAWFVSFTTVLFS